MTIQYMLIWFDDGHNIVHAGTYWKGVRVSLTLIKLDFFSVFALTMGHTDLLLLSFFQQIKHLNISQNVLTTYSSQFLLSTEAADQNICDVGIADSNSFP